MTPLEAEEKMIPWLDNSSSKPGLHYLKRLDIVRGRPYDSVTKKETGWTWHCAFK